MSESNIQKLRDLYAAFSRGDIGMILSSVSDDVDWGVDTKADVSWYGIRHGREGVSDFFATLNRDVEFTAFAPTTFAGVGDQVFVHVDIGYKIKKNGRTASTGSIHEFTLRDGNLMRFRAYEDTAGVRDAWNG